MSYDLFVDHFELMNLSTKIAQFGVRSYELRLTQVQHCCCTLCCVAVVVGLFAHVVIANLLPCCCHCWYSFPYEGRCWSMYMEINYEVRAIVVIQNVELFGIVSRVHC
ncbi:uncharacterized protein LOC104899058 isoform X2 [Beta vulgaris subsp. vulgaris]|uniref:uncharacterized protein LOC104899058 isoform X2 n=1 Tax=Beta vulgaris subsp. vulgaris TaxID=3555 RepID=UPI0020372942|nr:uncharacterized protein LOC104899058 isoform X2 [Beta vulgaris subsp. vulgaris]